jgi:hypothetical protein
MILVLLDINVILDLFLLACTCVTNLEGSGRQLGSAPDKNPLFDSLL